MQRFVNIGAREEQVNKWSEEALIALECEPSEQELLVTAIKNFTKEKKAQYASGYDSSD